MSGLRRQRALLGTYVEIGVPAAAMPSASLPHALEGRDGMDMLLEAMDAGFARIELAQQLWSFHSPDSELTALNLAGGRPVRVHPLTTRLLRAARAMGRLSDNLFNCTVGGRLVRLGTLPAHPGRVEAGPDAGQWQDIELRDGTARLHRGVTLTLDGIAKGFAVDMAVSALRRQGIHSGWVNAGGDLRVFGEVACPTHRREVDGRLTPLGALREAAMASSHSRLEEDGDDDARSFPALIVGPALQRPSRPAVWTVLAASAWRADALTKVACLAPPAQRAALVARLGGHLVQDPGVAGGGQ